MARERDRISKMNHRQAETDEKAALERERDRISKMNQRQAETEEQAALAREKHSKGFRVFKASQFAPILAH